MDSDLFSIKHFVVAVFSFFHFFQFRLAHKWVDVMHKITDSMQPNDFFHYLIAFCAFRQMHFHFAFANNAIRFANSLFWICEKNRKRTKKKKKLRMRMTSGRNVRTNGKVTTDNCYYISLIEHTRTHSILFNWTFI